ncbi:MAG: hypothetical protein NTX32_02640 [Candidatus Firestonebacteria bacterium]|nr:hypothetical protein [Candidatus Firestonebacteria bacterium]
MKIKISKRIYSVVTVAVLVFTLFLLPVRAEEFPGFLSDRVNPEKTSLTDFTPVEKPKL